MSTAAAVTAGAIGMGVGAASAVTCGILYSKAYKPASKWWKQHKVSVTVDIQETEDVSPVAPGVADIVTASMANEANDVTGDNNSNDAASDRNESTSLRSHETQLSRGAGFYHVRFVLDRANPLRIKVKGFQDEYFLVQNAKTTTEWKYFRETTLVAKVNASRWSPSITVYEPEEVTTLKRQKRFGLERLELPLSHNQSLRWNRKDKSLYLVSHDEGKRNPTLHMPAIGMIHERGVQVATNRGQISTMDLELTLRTDWDSYSAVLGTFLAARLWTRPDHIAILCDSVTEMGVRWAESCMFFYDMNPMTS